MLLWIDVICFEDVARSCNLSTMLLSQDLDCMRQDLATYSTDLKIEQDHAVR